MSSTVASNAWAEIVHHPSVGILEERWLPGQMTDGALKQSAWRRYRAARSRCAVIQSPSPKDERA